MTTVWGACVMTSSNDVRVVTSYDVTAAGASEARLRSFGSVGFGCEVAAQDCNVDAVSN